MTCDLYTSDDWLALARGEVSGEAAERLEAHAAGCPACARELAWLRTEARLFAERQPETEVPSEVWQTIERRLVLGQEQRRQSRQTWFRVGGLLTAAVAAALLLVLPRLHPGMDPIVQTPASGPVGKSTVTATKALDGAEQDYEAAIATLETEYAAKRTRMTPAAAARVDAELAKMRATVDATRELAANDVQGRRQTLHAYSAYVHSMQTIVLGGDQ